MDDATFEATRIELGKARDQAAAEGKDDVRKDLDQKLEALADQQERFHLDNLIEKAKVLNELSRLLDGAIQTIQTSIDNFLLTNLKTIRTQVHEAAGGGQQPPPPPPQGNEPGPAAPGAAAINIDLALLKAPHQQFANSVTWQLTAGGLSISGTAPQGTPGPPKTVERVWTEFGTAIEASANAFDVPVELIIATICTESRGNPKALRLEPGFVSDAETPHRVSPGLMQTLISTARSALNDNTIDRQWLFVSANSIRAGTAYIARQAAKTKFDPPVVACAYNAGSVLENTGANNRWKMKQFPIGTSEHADRFVSWFNDCFRFFEPPNSAPPLSFFRMLN